MSENIPLTPADREALQFEIERYIRLADKLTAPGETWLSQFNTLAEERLNASDCRLCEIYYDQGVCAGCPVACYTGLHGCNGTPYFALGASLQYVAHMIRQRLSFTLASSPDVMGYRFEAFILALRAQAALFQRILNGAPAAAKPPAVLPPPPRQPSVIPPPPTPPIGPPQAPPEAEEAEPKKRLTLTEQWRIERREKGIKEAYYRPVPMVGDEDLAARTDIRRYCEESPRYKFIVEGIRAWLARDAEPVWGRDKSKPLLDDEELVTVAAAKYGLTSKVMPSLCNGVHLRPEDETLNIEDQAYEFD